MVEKMIPKKKDVIRGSKPVNNDKKLNDLKIELLKNPTKRGRIKKEIARLLTMNNSIKSEDKA